MFSDLEQTMTDEKLSANDISGLFNKAYSLYSEGKKKQAVPLYQQILTLQSDHEEALHHLAIIFLETNQAELALDLFDKAIKINPDIADFHCNRGNALFRLNRYSESVLSSERALTLLPEHLNAQINRGIALHYLGRLQEAVISYDTVLAVDPHSVQIHANRGVALLHLNRYEEALQNCTIAINLEPGNAAWYCNRGFVLHNLNRHEQALADYEQALRIKPDYEDAHFNEGLCRLQLGDFERGWKKYEWRWMARAKQPFTQPCWQGNESLAGKTILLCKEQGLGDTIMFCRYAILVAALGAKVLMQVQTSLKPLMENLPGVYQVFAEEEPLPHFDYYCLLLSLPLIFRTHLGTIPAATPYLFSNEKKKAIWQKKLFHKTAAHIGLVWSGNPQNTLLNFRSLSLANLHQLLDIPLNFISLQKELSNEDEEQLKHYQNIQFFGNELIDFTDTAALIELMDLVITVDTSVAHLAGAMNRPVWVLLASNSDWRWLLNREDTPWYPGMRLFRQTVINDWSDIISRVADELRGYQHKTGHQ